MGGAFGEGADTKEITIIRSRWQMKSYIASAVVNGSDLRVFV
jgi:hypothetical protein